MTDTTDNLDLTDRQRIHCLGLEARVKELRVQLEEAEGNAAGLRAAYLKGQRDGYERGRRDAWTQLANLTGDLRLLADRIDATSQPITAHHSPQAAAARIARQEQP